MTELLWASRVYAEPAKADPAYDLLKKGDEYYKQGKYDDAIKCYEELITKYPESEYAIYGYTGLVISWGYKGRYEADKEKQKEYYEKSIEYAKQIIKKYPNNNDALHSYGVIGCMYGKLKELEESIYWFNQCVEKYIEEGNKEWIAHAISCLGCVYYMNKNFEKALSKFQELNNKYSDTKWFKAFEGVIYNFQGFCYFELKNFDKAIESFKIAIKKPGSEVLGRDALCYGIADIYDYDKKDIDNAKIWYKKVINDYPNSKWAIEAEKRLKEIEN
jgi:tetratricopeptide (TPR) repeat protein